MVTALLTALSVSALGQTSTKVPTFGAAAEIVTVDVVVLDKTGRVVRGLTKDDFIVTEEQRRQTISAFDAWEMPVDGAPDAPAGAGARPAQGYGERRPRAFAILVDDITLDHVPTATDLQKALASWAVDQLDARDEVTVVTTSGSVFWNGRAGRDQKQMLSAIERIRGLRPPHDVGHSRLPWGTGEEHRRAVYRLVEQISLALSGWKGRKAIVLVSQELRFNPEESQDWIRGAIDASRRANTAVYSIDSRFLTGASDFRGHLPAEPPGGFNSQPSGVALGEIREVHEPVAGARYLAEETGGFATTPANNLRISLDRVDAEARVHYLLGYEPDRALDGKWRRITVKVLKPDLTVRARRGYFARPRKENAVVARELGFMAVLREATPPRDFECRASMSEFTADGKERQGAFLLEIPGEAYETGSPPQLAFLAFVKDARGRPVVRLSHETTPGVPLVRTATGGIHFRKSVRLAPGDYTLDAVVLDDTSSRRCRDRVTFKVP